MNNAFKLVIVHMFILLLVIFSGCTKNEKNYTIETINGMKTFRNKNIPSTKDLVVKPVELFTILDADESSTDSTRLLNRISDFDVDSKNNLYILDYKNNSMKKFDNKGNYIKSFGRRC